MMDFALKVEVPSAAQAISDAASGIGSVDGVDEVCKAIHRGQQVPDAATGVEEAAGHAAALVSANSSTAFAGTEYASAHSSIQLAHQFAIQNSASNGT